MFFFSSGEPARRSRAVERQYQDAGKNPVAVTILLPDVCAYLIPATGPGAGIIEGF
jgi:hypothetical protein